MKSPVETIAASIVEGYKDYYREMVILGPKKLREIGEAIN